MTNKGVTVTLGEMAERADRHLASGRFASMSELVRAGLRALDREEAALDALVRARVAEALADDRPSTSLAQGMATVRANLKG